MFEILVPTIRSNGKFISTRFHRIWDAKVRSVTKGLSVLPPIKGQWVSPGGELFSERMIPVRIACTRQQIEQIADMSAAYYEQKAILFYRISDDVVIKHYGNSQCRS